MKDMDFILKPYVEDIKLTLREKIIGLIEFNFIYILNFAGPYLGFIKKIRSMLWVEVDLPKTER
tara:strand:- start:349 stop:540 length:192 start_codon:yes stop_codon:yes gene_type:complete